MRNLLSCLILSICLSSCQDSISLDQIKEKNRLVIYAFPTTNDTITIKISASQPIHGKAEKLNITSVRCETNSEDDKIVFASDSEDSGTTVITYYAIGKHQSGDRIHISVNASNLQQATAQTIIPTPVAIIQTRLDTTFYKGARYTQLRMSFTDSELSTFYAVRVAGRYVPEDELTIGKTEFVELETSAEPILNFYSTAELKFGSWNDYYHNMYIFDDSSFKNKNATLHLYTLQKSWIEHYKTQLFVLSPEFYHMVKSLNDIKNNEIGANGLSFMFSTFTNVRGGFGCVAGYCMDETKWQK